ncbi:3-succinoylsemialdehyde-pyridine dehydrogenase [compost metagenome]
MNEHTKIYIAGRWTAPASSQMCTVTEAASGRALGSIPLASAVDANQAVAAARAAFQGWSSTPPAERARWLGLVAQRLSERGNEIAALISREVGTPIAFSQYAQAGLPAFTFGQAAAQAAELSDEPERVRNSEITREPVGVVACITPWNFPLHQVAAKVAPALAAGCTVVLKPSEVAPLSAFLLAEIFHEIGFPAGAFNLVSGTGPEVGEAIAGHPEVDMVSFTGSTRAGQRVGELAARDIKRVALELGGKSPVVLLDDADFDLAVPGALGSSFMNNGQTCVAQTRMLVSQRRASELCERVVAACAAMKIGDPLSPSVTLGPLASDLQLERVRGYIRRGLADGARLLTGGPEAPAHLSAGYFVKPTVFADVTHKMTIGREEIFGPVLSIMTYSDEDDAVRIANDTEYGLGGGVWSSDLDHARRIARRIRTGQVDINGAPFNPLAPFGGYKRSGIGRELGSHGFSEYFELKSIQFPAA